MFVQGRRVYDFARCKAGNLKYKISEISKMSGFSPSGIRFFEEAGLIKPTRSKNQKYREYSLTDLQIILFYKQYRKCGMSLQQAIETLKHSDIQSVRNDLDHQASYIRQEINRAELKLEYIENRKRILENINLTDQKCEIVELPALLFLPLWQPDQVNENFAPPELVCQWLEQAPIVNSYLLIDEKSLLGEQEEISTTWGLAIEESHAELMHFLSFNHVKRINKRECVRTIVRLSDRLTILNDQLNGLREFIKANHLQPSGVAVSRLFLTLVNDNEIERYDYLWLPVCKAS